MYRLVKKIKDNKEQDAKSLSYAKKLDESYGAELIQKIKESIKNDETENFRVDLDELFTINKIKQDSLQAKAIAANPTLLEILRMTSFIFNLKAMVALTKEKYRLALQNLVRGLGVASKVVISTGDLFMHFVLLINCAFVLYKLDKIEDSIAFCNQALIVGEQALGELTANKGTSAKDCIDAAKIFVFALFFVRGGDNFGGRGREPDFEQMKRHFWIMLSEAYYLLAEILGSSDK